MAIRKRPVMHSNDLRTLSIHHFIFFIRTFPRKKKKHCAKHNAFLSGRGPPIGMYCRGIIYYEKLYLKLLIVI